MRFDNHRLRMGLLAAGLAVALGCGAGEPEITTSLPVLDPESFAPEARSRLQQRLERAESNPRDAGASGELGMLLHAVKRYDTAVQCYRRAAEVAPETFRWRYYLAAALAEAGRHDEAVAAYHEALRIRGEYEPARLRLADSLLSMNQYEESRQLLEAVIEESPHVAAAHYGLGRSLAGLGQATEALASYERACELAPEAGAAHYALALAYRRAGEDAKAQQHLQVYQGGNRTIPEAVDPLMEEIRKLGRDHHWFLNEGRRLDAEGRRREAITCYEEAIAISPDFYQAHVNLLGAYGMLGNARKAEHHYQRASEINPSVPELHYNWGVFEASRSRPADAARAFRKALELNPQFADAHQNLGMALEQMGQGEQAAEHYRRALFHDPQHRLSHFHLGRYLVSQERVAEGIQHLQQALAREDLRSSHIHYALSSAFVRIGENAKALQHAKRAQDLARRYGQHDFAAGIQDDIDAIRALDSEQ